jgi:hypothetical protein
MANRQAKDDGSWEGFRVRAERVQGSGFRNHGKTGD